MQKLGDKIEDLLDYRRQLEEQQSTLWAKMAFRGDSSLNIAARPLYRSGLSPATQDDAGQAECRGGNGCRGVHDRD